jgi:hypothetical protein
MSLSTGSASAGHDGYQTTTVAGQRNNVVDAVVALREQRSSTMKMFGTAGFSLSALVVAGLSAPAIAAAAPTGGSPAADVVTWLRDNGYYVQLNGAANGSLSQCIATGIHGMRNSNVDSCGRQRDPAQMTTVYVDVSCNNTN